MAAICPDKPQQAGHRRAACIDCTRVLGPAPLLTATDGVSLRGPAIRLAGRDRTLAPVLSPVGFRTRQFGKCRFGNPDHLNAEEEPQPPMWPDDPGFDARDRPCGVLDRVATAEVNPEAPPASRCGPRSR